MKLSSLPFYKISIPECIKGVIGKKEIIIKNVTVKLCYVQNVFQLMLISNDASQYILPKLN